MSAPNPNVESESPKNNSELLEALKENSKMLEESLHRESELKITLEMTVKMLAETTEVMQQQLRLKTAPMYETEAEEFIATKTNKLIKEKAFQILTAIGVTSVTFAVGGFLWIKNTADDKVKEFVETTVKQHESDFKQSIDQQNRTITDLVEKARVGASESEGNARVAQAVIGQVMDTMAKIENQSAELRKQLAVFSEDSQNKDIVSFVNEVKEIIKNGGSLQKIVEETGKAKDEIANVRIMLKANNDALGNR